jgi:hypothetical protein
MLFMTKSCTDMPVTEMSYPKACASARVRIQPK